MSNHDVLRLVLPPPLSVGVELEAELSAAQAAATASPAAGTPAATATPATATSTSTAPSGGGPPPPPPPPPPAPVGAAGGGPPKVTSCVLVSIFNARFLGESLFLGRKVGYAFVPALQSPPRTTPSPFACSGIRWVAEGGRHCCQPSPEARGLRRRRGPSRRSRRRRSARTRRGATRRPLPQVRFPRWCQWVLVVEVVEVASWPSCDLPACRGRDCLQV